MDADSLRSLCRSIVDSLDHKENTRHEISLWRRKYLESFNMTVDERSFIANIFMFTPYEAFMSYGPEDYINQLRAMYKEKYGSKNRN